LAAGRGEIVVLDKLWDWAKEFLNRDELINELFLAKDNAKLTAFLHAAFRGNLQILDRIWNWANEQLTQEELKKLVLAQTNYRTTA
jgi:endo-1,4-beta-D-glucanase Y